MDEWCTGDRRPRRRGVQHLLAGRHHAADPHHGAGAVDDLDNRAEQHCDHHPLQRGPTDAAECGPPHVRLLLPVVGQRPLARPAGPELSLHRHPLPLPANLSGDGCTVTNNYPGNQLTDVASPLWTQSDPSQIQSDVALAAATGLAGFAVSWAGTGLPNQTVNSSAFNQRLAALVAAVQQVNRQGTPFSLWIAYISSARIRTTDQINNDLAYLDKTYADNSAFDHSNGGKPTLIMMGSRKYPISVLNAFSARWRSHFYLVGDENWDTWNSAKAADFDADQYYWSSQNPLTNTGSFADIDKLAAMVRSSRNPNGSAKQFFAPMAPGYNKVLGGGSGCVPRLGGQTMEDLYAGNSSADPDGWMVISWNEIDEGTYIVPLERYGEQSLSTLKGIIDGPVASAG